MARVWRKPEPACAFPGKTTVFQPVHKRRESACAQPVDDPGQIGPFCAGEKLVHLAVTPAVQGSPQSKIVAKLLIRLSFPGKLKLSTDTY
jgi:hypothetical protein